MTIFRQSLAVFFMYTHFENLMSRSFDQVGPDHFYCISMALFMSTLLSKGKCIFYTIGKRKTTGPGCSKLTTSLVNVSLKF